MLFNNLRNFSIIKDIGENNLKYILASAGIDGRRRGETLSVAEYGRLSNLLQKAID
jgi:16S rRNA A1518/A1519 N6-dimethyltransferase RsmA/KsgA/DIM1 with predicted DNA glycosylase/AP lyase activity